MDGPIACINQWQKDRPSSGAPSCGLEITTLNGYANSLPDGHSVRARARSLGNQSRTWSILVT